MVIAGAIATDGSVLRVEANDATNSLVRVWNGLEKRTMLLLPPSKNRGRKIFANSQWLPHPAWHRRFEGVSEILNPDGRICRQLKKIGDRVQTWTFATTPRKLSYFLFGRVSNWRGVRPGYRSGPTDSDSERRRSSCLPRRLGDHHWFPGGHAPSGASLERQ